MRSFTLCSSCIRSTCDLMNGPPINGKLARIIGWRRKKCADNRKFYRDDGRERSFDRCRTTTNAINEFLVFLASN